MFAIKTIGKTEGIDISSHQIKTNPIINIFIKTDKTNGLHKGKKRVYSTMPDKLLATTMQNRYIFCKSNSNCYNRVLKHPITIKNYLRVASQLHRDDLWPLVHGQSSAGAISQRILNAIGHNGIQSLRIKEEESDQERLSMKQQLQNKINAATQLYAKSPVIARLVVGVQKRTANLYPPLRFDHQMNNRSYLLSATLGGLYCEFHESPLSLVFGGMVSATLVPVILEDAPGNISIIGNQKTQAIGTDMIQMGMRAKGFSEKKIHGLMEQLPLLYSEAFALPMGQLIVIGVPKSKRHFVYDSTSYGIPTGKPVSNKSEQVRLILSHEVMQSKEIAFINTMDDQQVDQLCAPSDKEVDDCMFALFGTMQPKSTEQESLAIQSYKTFTDHVDQVISNEFGLQSK